MSTTIIDFLLTLLGTFIGVFSAFWLDRWQKLSEARNCYADFLNSLRRDLANLSSLSRQLSESLHFGYRWDMVPLDTPVLDAAIVAPIIHQQASHGLLMCLTVLSTKRRSLQNLLVQAERSSKVEHDRLRDPLKDQTETLLRLIEYIQGLLDEEVKPLGRPIIRESKDERLMRGLQKVLHRNQDDGTASSSKSSTQERGEP